VVFDFFPQFRRRLHLGCFRVSCRQLCSVQPGRSSLKAAPAVIIGPVKALGSLPSEPICPAPVRLLPALWRIEAGQGLF
jgi:hypothetical protein